MGQAAVSQTVPQSQGPSLSVPAPLLPFGWAGGFSCSSPFSLGKHVFSWPFPSWPMFVSLAASEGCVGGHGNRQCPVPAWTDRAREVAAGTGGCLAGGQ